MGLEQGDGVGAGCRRTYTPGSPLDRELGEVITVVLRKLVLPSP